MSSPEIGVSGQRGADERVREHVEEHGHRDAGERRQDRGAHPGGARIAPARARGSGRLERLRDPEGGECGDGELDQDQDHDRHAELVEEGQVVIEKRVERLEMLPE
jgi:hypothetical protein